MRIVEIFNEPFSLLLLFSSSGARVVPCSVGVNGGERRRNGLEGQREEMLRVHLRDHVGHKGGTVGHTSARRCLLFFEFAHCPFNSKSNKTAEWSRSVSFRHSHLFHGPRDAFLLQLDILPGSHRRSVSQETGLRKVPQIQAVFVVWHNVLAVGKQVHQSRVHLHLSSAPDIRTQSERRIRSSRASSQCDHRADTPGSPHFYAKRQRKG